MPTTVFKPNQQVFVRKFVVAMLNFFKRLYEAHMVTIPVDGFTPLKLLAGFDVIPCYDVYFLIQTFTQFCQQWVKPGSLTDVQLFNIFLDLYMTEGNDYNAGVLRTEVTHLMKNWGEEEKNQTVMSTWKIDSRNTINQNWRRIMSQLTEQLQLQTIEEKDTDIQEYFDLVELTQKNDIKTFLQDANNILIVLPAEAKGQRKVVGYHRELLKTYYETDLFMECENIEIYQVKEHPQYCMLCTDYIITLEWQVPRNYYIRREQLSAILRDGTIQTIWLHKHKILQKAQSYSQTEGILVPKAFWCRSESNLVVVNACVSASTTKKINSQKLKQLKRDMSLKFIDENQFQKFRNRAKPENTKTFSVLKS